MAAGLVGVMYGIIRMKRGMGRTVPAKPDSVFRSLWLSWLLKRNLSQYFVSSCFQCLIEPRRVMSQSKSR